MHICYGVEHTVVATKSTNYVSVLAAIVPYNCMPWWAVILNFTSFDITLIFFSSLDTM